MRAERGRAVLGILGGLLIGLGAGLMLFSVWLHHMFIMNVSSLVGWAVVAIPYALLLAGAALAYRSVR